MCQNISVISKIILKLQQKPSSGCITEDLHETNTQMISNEFTGFLVPQVKVVDFKTSVKVFIHVSTELSLVSFLN